MTTQHIVYLVLVEEAQIFESCPDFVHLVSHEGVDDAGQDILLVQNYLLTGGSVLLAPTIDVDLDLPK